MPISFKNGSIMFISFLNSMKQKHLKDKRYYFKNIFSVCHLQIVLDYYMLLFYLKKTDKITILYISDSIYIYMIFKVSK
jgi:hypothetical protein